MSVGKFFYRNTSGNVVEGEISLHDHEQAASKGLRCRQVVNAKYSDADPKFGSAWDQGMASVGLFPKGVEEYGIPSTTVREAITGECANNNGLFSLAGNSIVAPSVPVGSSTPASRLFLPEAILDLIDSNMLSTPNYAPEMALFEQMIAESTSITGPIYTQPMIDVSAPREHDSRPIAQNALPRNLVSITASQSSKTVATESVGLQISDQANQMASLSLVSIILNQQIQGSRIRNLWTNISNVINGNLDAGETALSAVGFKATYDSGAAATTITHKGWLKALYQPERLVRFDCMVSTMDGYYSVQNRADRPLMFDPRTTGLNTGNAGTYGIDVTMSAPANFAALAVPFVFIIPDGILGANQILLMDSRYALRRVRNVLAPYSAIENMVLQRSTFMRFDHGELIHRLFSEAFLLLDYSNP